VFSVEEIIALAMQIEKNAEAVFREAAGKPSNQSLAPLLNWLADEENRHAKRFAELKPKVKKTTDDAQLEALGKSLVRGILGNQTFSLQGVDFSTMDQAEDLLKAAIEFEQDTVLFYEMIRSFVKETEGLESLDTIIEEEKSHIKILEEFLETGTLPGENDEIE